MAASRSSRAPSGAGATGSDAGKASGHKNSRASAHGGSVAAERGASHARGRVSRDAFIATTGRLLRQQGYAATGLNEIVASSGAPKGSLYFHFPGGKQELAIAAMEHSGERLRTVIGAAMSDAGGPAESLGRLIDALGAGLEASGFRDGCPIATVTLEAADSEPIRLAAERVFAGWLGALRDGLVAGGLVPEHAERRALHVLAAVEGALLLARARHDLAPLRAVRAELVALTS